MIGQSGTHCRNHPTNLGDFIGIDDLEPFATDDSRLTVRRSIVNRS
jgi:hypothetical protein